MNGAESVRSGNGPTISVRAKALKRLIISTCICAPVIGYMMWMASRGWEFFGPGMGIPLLPILFFLTELITGIEFGELAGKWDDLRGWQRGVLGTVIVAIAGGAIVMTAGIIVSFLAR
jgi:hypothetical protein